MKITDLNAAGVNSLKSGAVTSVGIGAYSRSGRSAAGTASDQVQLSGASRLAASALAAHADRLVRLKSLVGSGEYNPAADSVGKAIVAEALARAD